MIVCVSGGRKFADKKWLARVLDYIHQGPEGPITRLVQGGAPGADTLAKLWGEANNLPGKTHYANWRRHGPKRAGPIRNQTMLDIEKPDLVILFPGHRGTADMTRRVKAQGFKYQEEKLV